MGRADGTECGGDCGDDVWVESVGAVDPLTTTDYM